MKSHRFRLSLARGERGATIVLVAFGLLIVLGFTALAVDVGYVLVVRNEMQNAADAAALGGAGALFPSTPNPNWSAAEARATATIPMNKATAVALTDGVVQTGYWNLTGSPAGLQSKGITPGTRDAAAVMVTMNKATGSNGGPVGLFFARVVGINTMPVSANAVAVVSYPGEVSQGQLFPTAIPECLFMDDRYWNSVTHEPINDPSTGVPFLLKLGSAYHYDPCNPGGGAAEWTSFALDENNVPAVRDLIANGNPTPLGIGDNIWIEPGTKTSLYKDVPIGTTVLIPVVPCVTCGKGEQPIVGFAAFYITDSVGGSGKYIEGHFTTNYKVGAGSGGGPNYGAYVPPSLVK